MVPPGWSYAAGNSIIGELVRYVTVVSPEALVTISLMGRIKTKIKITE